MKKYYIDENPFVLGDIKMWDLLVDSLDSNNTTIELAEELINNTDAIDRMKINDLPLLWVYFYGTVALLENNELNFWK